MSYDRSPEGQKKMKGQTRDMLQRILNRQLDEKSKNDSFLPNYVRPQADFWKKEVPSYENNKFQEKEMMTREQLEQTADKLKKLIQKKDLDEHLRIRRQNQKFYENSDVLVNKQLLSKAGFLPQMDTNNRSFM